MNRELELAKVLLGALKNTAQLMEGALAALEHTIATAEKAISKLEGGEPDEGEA